MTGWSFRKNVLLLLLLGVSLAWSTETETTSDKKKVCVIGAGAAGLASVKHLAEYADEFDIVGFEKNSDTGGLWIYTDSTDLDEHNLPVHSSMYKHLRTNVPKDIMAYPDYRNFSGEENSCVSHETVVAYLRNFTDNFNLRPYIQFNTLVEKVTPIVGDGDWQNTHWQIRTRNLNTNEISNTTCDAVMVCNGHYFMPNNPKIEGIETFPGKVIHSHVYRKPDGYAGQTVVILGASYSGIDISFEISKFARKVYLSHNHDKINSPLPSNIEQVSGIATANGSTLTLKDGATITADAAVFCTGYLYSYPFLDETSGISVKNKQVVPLYKYLINIEHPSMSLIGIPPVLDNPNFYVQTKYYVALLRGKTQLPSKKDMLTDNELYGDALRPNQHNTSNPSWQYFNDLAQAGDFEPIPAFYRRAFEMWNEWKDSHLLIFREAKLRVLDNDTVQLEHPTKPHGAQLDVGTEKKY